MRPATAIPRIDLAPGRTAAGTFLDIPLDVLQKDSDGDGLTDLAEERLLTDPESRDTDGDGLEDAVDPIPLVPFSREAPPAQERALAAFVGSLLKQDQRALIDGNSTQARAANGGGRLDEKTAFLIANRALFSGLSPQRRLVVLTAEEARDAREKFGPFFAPNLELFFLDRAGRRAYVVWSVSRKGGQTLLAETGDGTWKATVTESWNSGSDR